MGKGPSGKVSLCCYCSTTGIWYYTSFLRIFHIFSGTLSCFVALRIPTISFMRPRSDNWKRCSQVGRTTNISRYRRRGKRRRQTERKKISCWIHQAIERRVLTCDVTKNRTTFQHRKQKILKKICCSSYTSITAKHTQFVKAVHCNNVDRTPCCQGPWSLKRTENNCPSAVKTRDLSVLSEKWLTNSSRLKTTIAVTRSWPNLSGMVTSAQ